MKDGGIPKGVLALKLENKNTHEAEYIPVSQELRRILARRPRREDLFPWSYSSKSSINRRFNEALLKVGVVGKTGFHLLRKSFSHKLQMAGVPVDAARRLMRHASIRVTDEHYTLYETIELAEILNGIERVGKRNSKKRIQTTG